jgi:hypothetical protein
LNKLRGFLGLTGYYCKSVKNYGQIVAPLIALLKKEAFYWTQEAIKAFEELKEAMCTTIFLATPDFTKTLILECDALGHSNGAI